MSKIVFNEVVYAPQDIDTISEEKDQCDPIVELLIKTYTPKDSGFNNNMSKMFWAHYVQLIFRRLRASGGMIARASSDGKLLGVGFALKVYKVDFCHPYFMLNKSFKAIKFQNPAYLENPLDKGNPWVWVGLSTLDSSFRGCYVDEDMQITTKNDNGLLPVIYEELFNMRLQMFSGSYLFTTSPSLSGFAKKNEFKHVGDHMYQFMNWGKISRHIWVKDPR